jgi:hypothetical protein
MAMMRQMVVLLMTALVIMTGANGIAMASNEIEHQKHCAKAIGVSVQDMATNDGHAHDHADIATRHAMPEHDHETCMIHACQALSPEMSVDEEPHGVLVTTLVWPETTLIGPTRTDDLQRPPKS